MKNEKKLPEILSREEIALLERCSNLKHKAIFALAYGLGLRRSKICRLKVQNIDSKHMRVFVRDGKDGKERYTVLSQSCLEILRDYWRAYLPKHPEALIPIQFHFALFPIQAILGQRDLAQAAN